MDRNEIRDQLAHVAVVVAIILPFLLAAILAASIAILVLTGIWAGLATGLLAEIKERGSTVTQDTVRRAVCSWKDLCGYSVGGLVLAIVVALIRLAL